MSLAFNRLFSTFAAVALPATGVSQPAGLDEELRNRIDNLFGQEIGQRAQWIKAGQKVYEYRTNWRKWVKRLYLEGKWHEATGLRNGLFSLLSDELDETFQLLHDVPRLDQLPLQYQRLVEWASLWIGQLI